MPNQTVKNGLKAKKIKLPQMIFFLKKQLIKFSCTYWLLWFCKILKKFLEFTVMMMCHFQAQNDPFIMNNFFLVQSSISSTYWPFSLCKIFKKFLQQIQSYEDTSFSRRKWFIHPKQFLFWKKLLMLFSATYWPLSLCKIFKKFLEPIQSYEAVPFFGQIYSNWSWEKFFSTDHYHYFHLPVGPFHWAKLKKKVLTVNPELWECIIFGPKMVHLPQKCYLKKIIKIIFICLLVPFIMQFPQTKLFQKIFW